MWFSENRIAFADPTEAASDAHLPLGPISFIFMEFLEKNGQTKLFMCTFGVGSHHPGNPGSATELTLCSRVTDDPRNIMMNNVVTSLESNHCILK